MAAKLSGLMRCAQLVGGRWSFGWIIYEPLATAGLQGSGPIDICINNAIQFPSGGNTYAPTEGKWRSARGPSPAGAGPVGHGLVAQRSGASHPVRPQFRPALAPGTAPRGTRRFAGALLAGTPAEVWGEPAPPLAEGASEGTAGPRLPNATVDHGANRRSHRARVRSALPSRSCRSADA